MAIGNDQQRATKKILEDESLISYLKDDEAKTLIDWALAELGSNASADDSPQTKVEHIRTVMAELNDLVGHRQTLVADDLEERMITLLVANLEPGSGVRLTISREIAQVCAEKDHLDSVELMRQLTQLSSKAWRASAQSAAPFDATRAAASAMVKTQAVDSTPATLPTTVRTSNAARPRPIPRPTKVERKQTGFFARWFGKK